MIMAKNLFFYAAVASEARLLTKEEAEKNPLNCGAGSLGYVCINCLTVGDICKFSSNIGVCTEAGAICVAEQKPLEEQLTFEKFERFLEKYQAWLAEQIKKNPSVKMDLELAKETPPESIEKLFAAGDGKEARAGRVYPQAGQPSWRVKNTREDQVVSVLTSVDFADVTNVLGYYWRLDNGIINDVHNVVEILEPMATAKITSNEEMSYRALLQVKLAALKAIHNLPPSLDKLLNFAYQMITNTNGRFSNVNIDNQELAGALGTLTVTSILETLGNDYLRSIRDIYVTAGKLANANNDLTVLDMNDMVLLAILALRSVRVIVNPSTPDSNRPFLIGLETLKVLHDGAYLNSTKLNEELKPILDDIQSQPESRDLVRKFLTVQENVFREVQKLVTEVKNKVGLPTPEIEKKIKLQDKKSEVRPSYSLIQATTGPQVKIVLQDKKEELGVGPSYFLIPATTPGPQIKVDTKAKAEAEAEAETETEDAEKEVENDAKKEETGP